MRVKAILEHRGEYSPTHKLTDDDVRAIRQERLDGCTYRAIGERYGICASNVYWITSGQTWSHVEPTPTPVGHRGGHRVGEPGGNKGERNGQAKLTEAKVWRIRAQREAGDTYATIAATNGISYTQAWNVCNDRSWVHVRNQPAPVVETARPGIFLHHQVVPARIWTVIHWLGRIPMVLVLDSTHRLVRGGDVEPLDLDTIVLRFHAAFGGLVQCR